jgi:hypothetical protein
MMSALGLIISGVASNQIQTIYYVQYLEGGNYKGYWMIPDGGGSFANPSTDMPEIGAALSGISGVSDVSVTEISESDTAVYP